MKKKVLVSGLTLLLGVGLFPACACEVEKSEPIVDLGPAPSFEKERVVDLGKPDKQLEAEGDDDFVSASKVVLHYHNDDKSCLNRRFYTWVTGVDGVERKPTAETWTSEDMSITLDFNSITE